MKKKIDWELVKAKYFEENLRSDRHKPYTLRQLGIDFKISDKTVRNKSSEEKWNDELRQKKAEQQRESLKKAMAENAETEAEIRKRQAATSKLLQEIGLNTLTSIPPEKLNAREATELLKLGMMEERKALGMSDKYEISGDINHSGFQSVEENMADHRKIEKLAAKLMKYTEEDCN